MNEDLSKQTSPWQWAWPTGRALIGLLFLVSGGLKFAFHGAIAGAVTSKGVPLADLVAWVAAMFEVGAALLFIFGIRLFETALALAFWCALTALMFHQFWAATGMQQQAEFSNFLKNIALIGALLIVARNARGTTVARF